MHDLPKRYSSKYYQCRKQTDGKYKLFAIGTTNEIFPGELFRSPQEARQYLQTVIIKGSR